MAQEQTQKCNNSSSGGANGGHGGGRSTARSCKKLKQKKIPQRGLGVAQLERIRLEEQQKKDGLLMQTPTVVPSANSIVYMGNSGLNVPEVSINDLNLQNSVPRQHGLILNSDATRLDSGSVLLSNNAAGNWAHLWNSNSQFDLNGESQKIDCHSLAIHHNENLPCETKTPVWSIAMHRSEHFQYPRPSSMANVPSGSLKSSVPHVQIEPPSNQIYGADKCPPLWQEEERMIGMKRSYPFIVEDAPGSSFYTKYPHAYASLIPGKAAPCSNDCISTIQPANTQFSREMPLSSNGVSEPKNKNILGEFGGSNGGLLTLAPPAELSSSYIRRHCQEVPDFDALPYQAITDEQVKWPETGQLTKQPFYSFLPPASAVNGPSAGGGSSNGEQAEAVDLDLKL
ncbi:hypothetical protein ACET3Z_016397 [Daucus carota]